MFFPWSIYFGFILGPDKSFWQEHQLNFDLFLKLFPFWQKSPWTQKPWCKMSFLISQMFQNKRKTPTGSSFVFDILYSSKRNRNNVWWELRNDKKLRKSLVGKTCYAQTDRLVNSDNSTESPILKAREGGNRKIFSFFNWTWISTQLFYFLDIYLL